MSCHEVVIGHIHPGIKKEVGKSPHSGNLVYKEQNEVYYVYDQDRNLFIGEDGQIDSSRSNIMQPFAESGNAEVVAMQRHEKRVTGGITRVVYEKDKLTTLQGLA